MRESRSIVTATPQCTITPPQTLRYFMASVPRMSPATSEARDSVKVF